MPSPPVIAAIAVAVVVVAVGNFWFIRRFLGPWRASRRQAEAEQALRQFRMQREQLEAKFFDLARTSGKPRGLKWLDGDWQSDVTFARACDTGLLTAFVGLHIRFEAIEGGDMEGIAAVDTVRDAAAVFHYQHGRWGTGGRVLMNMNPAEAVTRLAGQFEPLISSNS
ncbi:MAG: hypothetical protein FD138_980 [Planctomycetota bacterium]|nr:MAG: hypothetical protein FD138_980 [Planctomycetota bacterium]